jgi:hypothetical protein
MGAAVAQRLGDENNKRKSNDPGLAFPARTTFLKKFKRPVEQIYEAATRMVEISLNECYYD